MTGEIEVVTSLRADALVAKAEHCFELGLITASTLSFVTQQAYTNPEYNAILDLPFDWTVEEEEKRRKDAMRAARRGRFHRWLRSHL